MWAFLSREDTRKLRESNNWIQFSQNVSDSYEFNFLITNFLLFSRWSSWHENDGTWWHFWRWKNQFIASHFGTRRWRWLHQKHSNRFPFHSFDTELLVTNKHADKERSVGNFGNIDPGEIGTDSRWYWLSGKYWRTGFPRLYRFCEDVQVFADVRFSHWIQKFRGEILWY